LTHSERVTLRPYKHDEYERFLVVAYPYQFGMVSTISGTFIFFIGYLYSSYKKDEKEKND
jgi:oligosaccharyltransferase complex subunit beta